MFVTAVELGGFRALLAVPMLKDKESDWRNRYIPAGTRRFHRQADRAAVQNFAAQAVIAIENTRLLNELRQHKISLQQQTATADVLKVISRSTFDLQPVLDTLVESATRLCEAYNSVILLRDGERLRVRAHYGPIPVDFVDWPIGRGWVTGRAFIDHKPIHVHDLQAAVDEYPDGSAMAIRLGHRTILAAPLMREDEAIGALMVRRTEVRPFTDKQIELVTTFADQAVIAIENVRLFDEVQARTRDLTKSLQQQTATSNVLEVISRSAFDLQPIFETVAESAVKLCGADRAFIFRFDGEMLRSVVAYNAPSALKEFIRNNPIRPDRSSAAGRAAYERRTVHIPDVKLDAEYTFKSIDAAPLRTILAVPILKGAELLGVILTYSLEVRPFTDKQIALVETFADQAAIAIENVRLFDEVQARTRDLAESLQQQTATADVLKAISRSAFDLKTVLDALVEAAARLCEADQGTITREQGGVYLRVATYGFPDDFTEYVRNLPVVPERGTATGRALLEGKVVHIPDVQADPEYTFVEAQKLGGFRTILSVPMLREGTPIGVLTLTRHEVRPFTDKQIELVSTFADQAVIAIENVAPVRERRGPHARIGKVAGGPANGAGPSGADREARLARPTDRRHRARDQEPAQFRQQLLGHLGRAYRRIAGGACRSQPGRQAARTDQRDRGYAAGQSRQGRAARQACRLDRQEHAAALAPGLTRASAGRYQRRGRGEPQSRLSWGAGREAGLQHHSGKIVRSDRRRGRCIPAGYYAGAAQPDLKRLLCGDQAQSGCQWRRL